LTALARIAGRRYIQGMDEATPIPIVCSKLRPTRTIPRQFFYEIWQDGGDDNRFGVKISRPYRTIVAARTACDEATGAYLAKLGA
jgi:hypothetical protein